MSTPSHWYLGFFSGPCVRIWDAIVPPAATLAEVEFLVRSLGVTTGARILDMPCGAGRHAIPLAERGFHMTGVDFSEEFLTLARERAADKPLTLHKADMATWQADSPFDAAYCFGNSFGYLEHHRTLQWFANLRASLRPGAKFVFETGTAAETLFSEIHDRAWYEAAGIVMLIENKYDAWEGVLCTDFLFIENGVQTRQQTLQHCYTAAEIRRMLESTGFTVQQLLSGLDGTKFSPGKQRLYVICERN